VKHRTLHRTLHGFRLPRVSLKRRTARHSAARSLSRRRKRILIAVTAGALAAGPTAVVLAGLDQPNLPAAAIPVAAMDLTRLDSNRISRDGNRTVPSPAASSPAPASPSAAASRPAPPPPPPAKPKPVAGLDQAQMDNAAIIVGVAAKRRLPKRAMVVAIATVLQESNLYNCANQSVPESLKYPHQGASVDHDSVGLFQQRSSQGWGSVAQLMDPPYSAGLFYDRLVQVSGWESMSVTSAAQAVQRSGFPSAYAKHQSRAEQIVNALA
jgi:hypothetical protein